jgi:NADH dehydrogenase (ubiquinone) Fe-S protein 3
MLFDLYFIENLYNAIPLSIVRRIQDELFFVTWNTYLIHTLSYLKKHINLRFKLFVCLSGIDFLGRTYRFSVVYELLSLAFNSRIRIKVFLNEYFFVSSVTSRFTCANWWEREVWDLFGIFFSQHPNLRRILTDYGFEGNPLKKDFPLSGYTETRYSENIKKVVSEPLKYSQESRLFR